jgi:hypothetical protein
MVGFGGCLEGTSAEVLDLHEWMALACVIRQQICEIYGQLSCVMRLLFVPLILWAKQLVNYLLRMMTEAVHQPSLSSSANDQVSKIAEQSSPKVDGAPSGARHCFPPVYQLLLTSIPSVQ